MSSAAPDLNDERNRKIAAAANRVRTRFAGQIAANKAKLDATSTERRTAQTEFLTWLKQDLGEAAKDPGYFTTDEEG